MLNKLISFVEVMGPNLRIDFEETNWCRCQISRLYDDCVYYSSGPDQGWISRNYAVAIVNCDYSGLES